MTCICTPGRWPCPTPLAACCWWRPTCRPTWRTTFRTLGFHAPAGAPPTERAGALSRLDAAPGRGSTLAGGADDKHDCMARGLALRLARAWRRLLVLAVGASAVFLARFDPNSLKPRIEAAVQQATGRDLSLNGPISLKWSLWPTVALTRCRLRQPARLFQAADGDAGSAGAAARRAAAAAQPLRDRPAGPGASRHPAGEDAQGQSNWRVHPSPALRRKPPAARPAAAAAAMDHPARNRAPRSAFHDVQIEDGTLAWRDDRKGSTHAIDADAADREVRRARCAADPDGGRRL